MRLIRTVRPMQKLALSWRREGRAVGFVPTMGYLHEGHLDLMRRARRAVGRGGVVVTSIYVNPTQFGAGEDLAGYPRNLSRDRALCADVGVDALFLPSDRAMYPGRKEGRFTTFVVEESIAVGMEGASRPAHFRGVTTIVAKLFNCVLPTVAVFGAKDFQQAAVIRRMTHDLNFPVRILVAPTRRESDGLAMSSRNSYLTPDQRVNATCLHQALEQARRSVRSTPDGCPVAPLKARLKLQIERNPETQVDYIEFFDPVDLRPVRKARHGHRMALAVRVGSTRLIDNASL